VTENAAAIRTDADVERLKSPQSLARKQVAALCWRKKKTQIEVLLISSRETKRWVIPKGWPMDHLKDFNAAKTEAFEEAGVRGRVTRKPLGNFRYEKIKASGAIPVTVTVYGIEVHELTSNWPEKKQRKRQWFTVEDAAKRVNEAELKTLLLKLA
jgi:8-oxo-dGTP pyrophosphatase MutT (NUDIX family)